jgi:signal transduction histidine kinase
MSMDPPDRAELAAEEETVAAVARAVAVVVGRRSALCAPEERRWREAVTSSALARRGQVDSRLEAPVPLEYAPRKPAVERELTGWRDGADLTALDHQRGERTHATFSSGRRLRYEDHGSLDSHAVRCRRDSALSEPWKPVMRLFRDLPIRRKLMLVSVLTSGLVLLLASAAFVAYELITFRQAMVRKLTTQADIIGYNSASAIVFNDRSAAADTLAALRAEPQIVSAAIREKGGNILAAYVRSREEASSPVASSVAPDGPHLFQGDRLFVVRDVILDGEHIGSVHIESDLTEMSARLQRYASIVAVVLLASIGVAILVSSQLQRVISIPILHLADTARVVSEEKDYAVRARGGSRDEIGLLIETFNEMLGQIQQRDAALEGARNELEQRVRERTKDLRQEVGERRKAEEEIRRLNAELERRVIERTEQLAAANKELEAFSYSVSHDLRAPLRAIDGYSQALLEDYTDRLDPQARHYLDRVRKASQRMGDIIDDLLGLARVTRVEIRWEPVDLSALARGICEDLRQAEPQRNVSFLIQEGLVAQGDSALLRLALENLLSNAWKYTSKHATGRIELGMVDDDGSATYFVRDDGAGFDMEHAGKLFGTFQRLHSPNDFQGTGIGLATVQRIIHRHGGRIWAEGAVEQGAVFYFTLPSSTTEARDELGIRIEA